MANSSFYTSIPVKRSRLYRVIQNKKAFKSVPGDWIVVVADVKNSTESVKSGNHHDVNLAATGSIVAVLNTLNATLQNCEIPYFFGGDGVTFLIPPEKEAVTKKALSIYSIHIKKNLKLTLRTGMLKVFEIYDDGYAIDIAKYQLNKLMVIPLIKGNGLKHAEKLIKKNFQPFKLEGVPQSQPDLEGLECRWDIIYPREKNHKVVATFLSRPSIK